MRTTTFTIIRLTAAIACLGGMSIASPSFAAGCINPKLPQRSLTEDARPDDQHAYDMIAKQGNRCTAATQQPASPAQVGAVTGTQSSQNSQNGTAPPSSGTNRSY